MSHSPRHKSQPSAVDTSSQPGVSGVQSEQKAEPLEDLIEQYVTLHRHQGAPSIEEFAAQHPALADEIREIFPTVLAVENLKAKKQRAAGSHVTLAGRDLKRLGDFRIVREIGRGGMGVVFEAEQLSLGRHVAIKVLPNNALHDQKQLARFHREAQTAAQLHHTNIVPIFGVGQHDGFHYIVMQLIDGVGLDQILEGRMQARGESIAMLGPDESTAPVNNVALDTQRVPEFSAQPIPPRTAESEITLPSHDIAGLGWQMASALAYAHDQDTLHRDIKPANLLLDKRGVLWIADFGLAKALHQSELSQSGDLVGTLRYMAPERFRGDCDKRSDIYSIGLTLYELLAGRPAFTSGDHSELMRQVMQEEPVALRKIDASIPRDLETIVIKCIAKDPSARYQHAADVATDLRRFLDDRPIVARRTHLVERGWRWCRRNPAIASLGIVAVALLMTVAVVSSTAFIRTSRALENESLERERAETTLAISLEALEKVYASLAPDNLGETESYSWQSAEGDQVTIPIQPVLSIENMVLLQELLVFYDRLGEQGGENLKLLEQAARANARVGDIQRRLGHYEQASKAFEQAIKRYQLLAIESDHGEEYAAQIGKLKNELGLTYSADNQHAKARATHQEALKALVPRSHDLKSLDRQFELARAYYLLGRPRRHDASLGPGRPGGHARQADPLMHGDRPPHAKLPRFEEGPPQRAPHFPPESELGPQFVGAGQNGKPNRKHLDQATRILEELDRQDGSNPRYKRLLAQCYRDEDGVRNKKSVSILRGLVERFPNAAELRYDLADMLARVGGGPGRQPLEPTEVRKRLIEARDILDSLAIKNPQVPTYDAALVRVLFRLGEFFERESRHGAIDQRHDNRRRALASLRAAVQLQDVLVKKHPAIQSYQLWQLVVREVYGRRLVDADRLDEARELLEQSSSGVEQLDQSLLSMEGTQVALHNTFMTLHFIYRELGEPGLADEALVKANGFQGAPGPNRPPRHHPPR